MKYPIFRYQFCKHSHPHSALIVRLATVRRVRLPHRRLQKPLLLSPSLSHPLCLSPLLSLSLSLFLGFIRAGSCRGTPISALVLFQSIGYPRARVQTTERERRPGRARGGYYAVPPPAARARVGDGAPRSKARRPRRRHYSAHAIIVGHGRALSLFLLLPECLLAAAATRYFRATRARRTIGTRVPRECRRDSP